MNGTYKCKFKKKYSTIPTSPSAYPDAKNIFIASEHQINEESSTI